MAVHIPRSLHRDGGPDSNVAAQRLITLGRLRYVREAQRFAAELQGDVARGALSAQQAAEQAAAMRNGLLDAARLQNSDIGRAVSEAEKAAGRTFAELIDSYATRLFGRAFRQLTPAQQDASRTLLATSGEWVAAS